ncbi:MAG: type II toxin-antitoxin system Phd/YefM family antitoxin [Segniliparus sp.]|uniref:type II toxin-antitoxin system Phd/YefM family antitoxin n=1 Tax=Segniliparus sp. TaxID=2804064 RepID=UPI003F2F2AAC
METVSVRDLRNHGGEVLDRVQRGETLLVTKNGEPVAELRPTRRRNPTRDELISAFQNLPPMDYESFRRDVDSATGSWYTIWDREA